MKKLSALIFAISLIGLFNSNVFAQCDCGYVWELGPGTLVQDLDFSNLPNVGVNSYTATSTCGDWSLTQYIPQVPYYGPQDAFNSTRIIVQPGPDGLYQTADDYATQQQTHMVNHGSAVGDWGTGVIDHYGPTPGSCAVTIEQAQFEITGTFYQGNYSSTQTSVCDIDPAATSPGVDNADTNSLLDILKGYVTADPTVGVEIIIEADLASFIPQNPPFSMLLTHNITRVRVEYFSRLPEDINNDGVVDVQDFLSWSAAFGASPACYGTNYYN